MKARPDSTTKADLYERVTARIVDSLSKGTRPWHKPWADTARPSRPLRHNGEPYRGMNVLLLWSQAMEQGYQSPTWMTYKQAQDLGAQVRRGESGAAVVFASAMTKTHTTEAGDEEERSIPFLRAYTVFNVDQVEGLPARFQSAALPKLPTLTLDQDAEDFFRNTGAVFRHGGSRAYYSPHADAIQLPSVDAFHSHDGYLSTKAHELMHWTGHPSRLNREFGRRFGDDAYAFEELVAEIGAAFVCADLGVTTEVCDDHAAYLAAWLKVLKADKRAIFTAAAQAQRAADFVQSLQTEQVEPLAA